MSKKRKQAGPPLYVYTGRWVNLGQLHRGLIHVQSTCTCFSGAREIYADALGARGAQAIYNLLRLVWKSWHGI